MHPLPSVFLMELDIPEGFVTQLNEYLDGLLEEEGPVHNDDPPTLGLIKDPSADLTLDARLHIRTLHGRAADLGAVHTTIGTDDPLNLNLPLEPRCPE